jgi:hypothetical protein
MHRFFFFVLLAACGPKEAANAPRKEEFHSDDPVVIERHNKAVPYRNRAIEAGNAGDWTEARKALQECVAELDDPDCKSELQELESRHRF